MACNKDLEAQGKIFPRTCADCGLGPCKKKSERGPDHLKEIAGRLHKLTYRDMSKLAGALSDQIDGGPTKEEMTEILLTVADELGKDA